MCLSRCGDTVSKTYLVYDKDDFLLYSASLIGYAMIAWFALENLYLWCLLCSGLAFLWGFFIRKHGATLDLRSLVTLVRGIFEYLLLLVRELRASSPKLGITLCIFIAAVLLEQQLSPMAQGSWLAMRLPFEILFYLHFGGLSLYRTYILYAHFKNSDRVSDILKDSNWKQFLGTIDIRLHILQAYITGLLCHFALLAPPLIFYRLTQPTVLREGLLIVGTLVVQAIVFYFLPWRDSLDGAKWYHDNHQHTHQLRFEFTIMHGHHHDAIPSSLIGAAGVGLMEGVHRPIARLHFLLSVTLFFIRSTLLTLVDLKAHQYIPGVFPYAAFAVGNRDHHMAHHYLSLRPLGIGLVASPFMQWDLAEGYSVNNGKVDWYLKKVAEYEQIEEVLLQEYRETKLTTPPSRFEIFMADFLAS